MKKLNSLLLALTLIFFVKICSAQDLKEQYKQVIEKSNSFKEKNIDYKVVNENRLETFAKNNQDSVQKYQLQLVKLQNNLKAQQKKINDLENNISQKNINLESSQAKLDEISLLGISFKKSTYHTLVWTIITALFLFLLFAVFKSSGYRKETNYRIKLFDELTEEFKAFKIKANDKEKKLARELQNEKNKIDEMAGRFR